MLYCMMTQVVLVIFTCASSVGDMLAVSKKFDFRVLAALVVELDFVVLQFNPCMSGN